MLSALRFRYELFQIWIQCIAGRDDPDKLTVFDHRHMAEAVLVHYEKRIPE